MEEIYNLLRNESRLLMEVALKPLQGERFQPTGFPDLGPARYTTPDGIEMLLVESSQSVANRMELACWDETKDDLIEGLEGLPYIKLFKDGVHLTNSILEAHRINSEYIMKGSSTFKEEFIKEIDYKDDLPINWSKFVRGLLKYDINSIIHGVFLEEISGRLRIARALTGFIEAKDVIVVESGGVKFSRVKPQAKKGEGNVPYHRTEFVAKNITAYFNLDLALLRSYAFEEEVTELMVYLSLFKILRFLSTGLRLRTACDLYIKDSLVIKKPAKLDNKLKLGDENKVLEKCSELIKQCKNHFNNPPVKELECYL